MLSAVAVVGTFGQAYRNYNSSTLNTKLQEKLAREMTGEGGYPLILPYFTQIDPAIVEKEKIVIPEIIPTTFGVLNNSESPVFGARVRIMQRVPQSEGFMGTDRKTIYAEPRQEGIDVFRGMGPTMINARGTIAKGLDNWFDVVTFARAATFSQSIVVTWNGDSWETDYELRQLADPDRGNDELIIHSIREDFPYVEANPRLPKIANK